MSGERRESIDSVTIRPYLLEDYPFVRKILEKEDMFDPVWESEESLKKAIEDDPETILVAVVDDEVVGNVFLKNWWGHGGWIFRLAVKEDFRGRGIGSMLMDEAESRLKERGVKSIALFINPEEIKLKEYYEKRGYGNFGIYEGMGKDL